ncbi:DNA ligase [Mycobacterium europaeum]|uniref:DNA ligase n=1 Tax=Mycobacterium europaeum TaxID=761804 RepID=A0A0U1CW88_9MYCO|nr:WGR domain-containing protein [Mycobacterium europaeum]CQD02112.1 DNA ligase [Mycobacterium europaeum]
MNNCAESVSLYYQSGSSDKVYHAQIEQADGGGFLVNVAYGRRGGTLSTGTKTKTPVDYDAAVRIFDKLVAEKQSKGYTTGAAGTPYLHNEKAGRVSGLLPQLLNVIDETGAARLVADPQWGMQEKFDGRRLMLRKVGTTVEGINKLGLVVSVAAPVATAALDLPGEFVMDGEVIDDTLHVFDVLSVAGTDLRELAYGDRYQALTTLTDNAESSHIRCVSCWTDATDKGKQLEGLQARNAEGVVFKRWDAPYRQGRPSSGGPQLKLKFVATVSAVVTTVNQQRSVGVSLLNGDVWQAVGNVTVPANQHVPKLGDVVEIRYLYAAQAGGALYQPVLLGIRDDVEPAECVLGQLKLKSA